MESSFFCFILVIIGDNFGDNKMANGDNFGDNLVMVW